MLRPYAARQSFIFIENFQKTKLLLYFNRLNLVFITSITDAMKKLFGTFEIQKPLLRGLEL
ncbi:MAG: hypothetical protein HW421_4130 [Ignavibacteria bacterium]|nr:hypothetical protein [Ignavibacteria bacterium]